MNYFKYYKELTQRILPIKEGVSMNRYHIHCDINRKACKTAFDEFSGRTLPKADFKQLLKLCLNAEDKGSYIKWTNVKFTEPRFFIVSRQGIITELQL